MLSLDNYNDATRLIDGNFDGRNAHVPPFISAPDLCNSSAAGYAFLPSTAVQIAADMPARNAWAGSVPLLHGSITFQASAGRAPLPLDIWVWPCIDPRLTDYELLMDNLKTLKRGQAAQVGPSWWSVPPCSTSTKHEGIVAALDNASGTSCSTKGLLGS